MTNPVCSREHNANVRMQFRRSARTNPTCLTYLSYLTVKNNPLSSPSIHRHLPAHERAEAAMTRPATPSAHRTASMDGWTQP